jgi:TP901 family phage tail tape measure protein
MAKEIKFNIKLSVDGKEQIVTATSDLNEMQKNISRVRTAASDMRDALISFNQGFEVLRNISSTFNDLTEESRSFGAAMNTANTMAGKSGEDFSKLKDQVAELAKDIPMAREELANGLYQVISNSVPEDNWITFLQKSAKASVGGVADLGEAVKVTSTVIKNYGLSWDAAGDIQDKIQLTAKNGVISFEQLAQALPRVTGNAATLGVSIDELMATFSTLTGVSGNTAEVSTQLAAVFTALVKPSSEASKMAEQMGISFNAASIKAAGGLQNFLADLDKNVKQYAQKSGMLEQEIYGKLFGSAESLRAIGPLTGQLADKFNENISSMKDSAGTIDEAFSTMSSSGAASFQMMKNQIAEFADGIASALSGIMPYLNIATQVGNSVIAISTLVKAWQSLGITQAIVRIRTTAANAAFVVSRATMIGLTAITRALNAAFTGAAVGATTLKYAIRSLLVATGVGIAIVALTEVINAFISKSSEAKDKADEQAEAMKEMNSAADEVKNAYDSTLKSTYSELMSKYDKLKEGWKALSTEQQKMQWIKQNQSAFGELQLKIDSVTEAENIFNNKTDAVVEAFKQRAMAAAYAAKLTALYQKQIDLLDKKKKVTKSISDDAKNSGRNAKEGDIVPENWRNERYGKVGNDGEWRFTKIGAERYSGTNVSGNKQIYSIDKSLNAVNQEITDTQKQLAENLKANKGFITAGKPVRHIAKNTTNTPSVVEPKTYIEKLQAQLSAAQKEKDNALTIEARVEADAKVKKIQAQIDEATKGKVTIEAATEPTYIVAGSAADKRKSYSNAQQRIGNIRQDYDSGLIDKASAQKAIADINDQLSALELKPIEVHFKTPIEELQEQLQNARRSLDEATTIEARTKASAKITEIQAEIDEATKGKVSIAAEVTPEYIEQGSAADKRQSYSNAQQKTSRIQNDYEIGIIGKDEAMKQIDEVNKELADLGLKPIKITLEPSGFDKAFEQIQKGWGSVQNISGGIQGISDALEGNGNAWEKTSAMINGFISIAQGIQGIVELYNLLSVATTAHAAATAADTTATTVNTGVTAANTAASTVNTVAKEGEAIANATASGAKMPFPANLIAIAAGVAAVVAAIAAMSSFATGGVVGGTSTFGDRKFARVNSGEMILNKTQQAHLFQMINTPRYTPPSFVRRELPQMAPTQVTPTQMNDVHLVVDVRGKTRGTSIEQTLSNVRKIASKSGRRSNLV